MPVTVLVAVVLLLAAAVPASGLVVRSAGRGDGSTERAGAATSVRLLGERVVPKGLVLDGMPVGELSGIDYDPHTKRWYAISDDSEEAPARLYTIDMTVGPRGLSEPRFVAVTPILRTDGTTFPPLATQDPEVADPEAVRFDRKSRTFYWSSEGKREISDDGSRPALVDPWVRQMTVGGRHLRQLRQPAMFSMSADEQGPRRNAVFEGLTLSADGREVVTSLEGPLYQDGLLPTPASGGISRFTWYDKRRGVPVRQLAYEIDPIPATPIPPGSGADNGVVEILAVDRHRLLVLERSFVTGVGNSIRLYQVDVRGATDVLGRESLADGGFHPVRKRLLVDLATLGLGHIDNVEGMTWGPRLPGGGRTLVLLSDDNFNPLQVTQLIALAIPK